MFFRMGRVMKRVSTGIQHRTAKRAQPLGWGCVFLVFLSLVTASVSAEEVECFKGEYVVERSSAPAVREKLLESMQKAAMTAVDVDEEMKRSMLVRDRSEKRTKSNSVEESSIVGESRKNLCGDLKRSIRAKRRGALKGQRRIVRNDGRECTCNYVMRASNTPNDSLYAQLWGMHQSNDVDMDAPEAWDSWTGSSGTIVAVIDTGVDYNHPDLADNMWRNPNEIPGNGIDDDGNGYVDDIFGINSIRDNGNPMDDHGHGTHCSGSIGAVGDNGRGVVGVSWDVSIIGVKFLSASGSGRLSDAIQSIEYVTALKNAGNNIILSNNSWGGGGYSSAIVNAITAAKNADLLFVAAAGNAGVNADNTPMYPAAYSHENIISVAAIASSGALAGFSNYGRTRVDIGAPGVSITSTLPNNRYASWSGTSMATPNVSGALALLSSYSHTMTWQQLRDNLYAQGTPLASLNGKTVTGKLLNVNNMLSVAAFNPMPPFGQPTPTPTPEPPTVALNSAIVNGDLISLNYDKNFDTCAHVWLSESGAWTKIMAGPEFLCMKGSNVEVDANISIVFDRELDGGSAIKLCHGTQESVCSSPRSIVDLTPTPTPTPEPGYFDLLGKVVDTNGVAIAQARVELSIEGEDTRVFYTGADGAFGIDDVYGPVPYTIVVVKAGYQFNPVTSTLVGDVFHEIQGSARTYRISGLVISPAQEPLVGAIVNGGALGNTVTDSDGKFFYDVDYGSQYSINVSAEDRHFDRNDLSGTIHGNVGRVFVGKID